MFVGKPQPAGHFDGEIKLIRELVSHPGFTIPVRIQGDDLTDLGIYDNDILVGDGALQPSPGKTIIMMASTGLIVRHLSGLWLVSDSYPHIMAVATHVIHRL